MLFPLSPNDFLLLSFPVMCYHSPSASLAAILYRNGYRATNKSPPGAHHLSTTSQFFLKKVPATRSVHLATTIHRKVASDRPAKNKQKGISFSSVGLD
jgi:hypothetical protein